MHGFRTPASHTCVRQVDLKLPGTRFRASGRPMSAEQADQYLIEEIRSGSEAGWRQLIDRYQGPIACVRQVTNRLDRGCGGRGPGHVHWISSELGALRCCPLPGNLSVHDFAIQDHRLSPSQWIGLSQARNTARRLVGGGHAVVGGIAEYGCGEGRISRSTTGASWRRFCASLFGISETAAPSKTYRSSSCCSMHVAETIASANCWM